MNQEQIRTEIEKLIARTEKEIDKVWSERLDQLLKDLNILYSKATDDEGHIGWTEINKYNRLNKELEMIAKNITGDYSKVATLIKNAQENIYLESYLMYTFVFEYASQKIIMKTYPNIEQVRSALEQPIEFIKLLPTLAKQRAKVLDRIRVDIAQGIMAGEGFGKIAKRLRDNLSMTAKQSKRVARTEGKRAMTQASLDSAKQAEKNGIDIKKRWHATLDGRTRDTHQSLDGQTVPLDKNFKSKSGCVGLAPTLMVGLNAASENINCRCTMLHLIDDELPEVRRIKNEDGTSSVIPFMSYEEYIKTLKQR